MAEKTSAEVSIGGKVFTLSGYESEEYLQRIASYLNNKLAQMRQADNYHKQTTEMQSLMMELNIADDYFQAKKQVEKMERDFAESDKEIYSLKRQLIDAQVSVDDSKQKVKELNRQLEEARLRISQLESALKEK